jgi:hypothetical protein
VTPPWSKIHRAAHVRHFCKADDETKNDVPEADNAAPEVDEAAPEVDEALREAEEAALEVLEAAQQVPEEASAAKTTDVPFFLEPFAELPREIHPLVPRKQFTFIFRDYFEPISAYNAMNINIPGNRKVKMMVNMNGADLSSDNMDTLAKLCGPRYCVLKKKLTLVSEEYQTKWQNQKAVIDLFRDIIEASQLSYAEEEVVVKEEEVDNSINYSAESNAAKKAEEAKKRAQEKKKAEWDPEALP